MSSAPPARAPWGPWGALVGLSVALALAFQLLGLPAAIFLGGMVAGLALALRGGVALRPPAGPLWVAQALIGCLIARAFNPQVVAKLAEAWPLFLGSVTLTMLASVGLSWALGRGGRVPSSTAIWGLLPGGSIAMMLMAEAFGADAPCVAFIQNLRLIVVASLASLIAAWATPPAASGGAWLDLMGAFPPTAWPALGATAALVALCVGLAQWWRGLPVGSLLLAMALGGALHGAGWLAIELPPWLLGPSFLLLGWAVGLRFTAEALRQAAWALPHVLLAIAGLVAFCGLQAWALVGLAGVDPLTAYLATSPGGADSVAIVAAGSPVDLPFVMTLQSLRVLVILLVGPAFARAVARRFQVEEARVKAA